VRNPALRPALKVGALRAVAVGVIAVAFGAALSHAFDTGHAALYAVLMTSSSAALVLPIVDGLGLSGPTIVALLPQVAIADAACIVLLPLAIEPSRAGRSALGALAVLACSGAFFLFLREAERRGWQQNLHDESKQRNFALELRISLGLVFGLAAIAVQTHVSIMLAGFGLGIAVTAVSEPRRLARQMFGITEGFFGPLFFVWLGASLNLRALGDHPSYIGLGVLLGLGAVVSHTAMVLTKQPPAAGAMAAAQLGVPVAAATLGQQLHLLKPGEPAALMLGALVTIAIATVAGGLLSRTTTQSPPRNGMSAGETTGLPRSS
jgi:Kef-type K+ transport system membrane component KefB